MSNHTHYVKRQPTPAKRGTIRRLFKMMIGFYPVVFPLVIVLILISAAVGAIPAVFMQQVISIVEKALKEATPWQSVAGDIFRLVTILAAFYIISLISSLIYHQLIAVMTQGTLRKMRDQMFRGMQDLPIRYFDQNSHGDIMSYYTNDIDTMRQMISQSFPQLLISGVTVVSLLVIMLSYSLWMTLVVVGGVSVMFVATKKIGGRSAKYFVAQQRQIGVAEGVAEELMNGQKVIKVFCHEEQSKRDFDRVNDELFGASEKANKFANTLGPVLNNIGNILYVIVAIAGGIFLSIDGFHNVGFAGLALTIDIVIPFLNMTKQFAGNVNQVSHQINPIVMGIAGVSRIFDFLDEKPEADDGYVTLVNAKEENGVLTESETRTGMWAWKHPHTADGSVTYTPLRGDVRMTEVDFAYTPEKTVLHDVTLFAEPGQKVAFVGATGAGKTTITNLINRFYDIADGKIRYDGININKIKKSSLRRSLGIVLQDTNLFTGTVMENIRYGLLEATDEECIAAAKLAGAHDFIVALPEGYQTMLTGNGANLSQGQRQLIAIARAAVADPPVMILDEATSSIDTRTEATVQRGMDALMKGRTVFVIAHRLSTVKNSDVIMVLDHGRIIERGSHADLLAKKGTYYSLYTGAFELE